MRVLLTYRFLLPLLLTTAAWLCVAHEPARAGIAWFDGESNSWTIHMQQVAPDPDAGQLHHANIGTGRHHDPNARLRSRTHQLRQAAQNNHPGSITALSPVFLSACPRAFNSIPWTNYRQPHLIYSYRMFLF